MQIRALMTWHTCARQDDLLVQLSTGCQLDERQISPDEVRAQLPCVQRVLRSYQEVRLRCLHLIYCLARLVLLLWACCLDSTACVKLAAIQPVLYKWPIGG